MAHLHRKHAGTRDTVAILRHELAQADRALPHSGPADEAVHTARRSLKKCRATLRLLRHGLTGAGYRRLNHKLRDAARPLSSVRDGRVLLDTLQQLRGRQKAGRSAEAAELREALQREYAAACAQFVDSGHGLRQTRAALRSSRRKLARLKVRRAGWAVLGPSLLKVYELGRTAMHEAQRCPGDEEL
ncbi:MAG: CHAD domain-containing protein, partial [Sinobacteraceae bacterium]|nr:CHAD domain-containing protein [Nevskiaceae bacterium]